MIRSLLCTALCALITYGVLAILVRLHLTQMAYSFDELKAYERSLKEEELRLRAQLAEQLSPERLAMEGLGSPSPSQIVRIP